MENNKKKIWNFSCYLPISEKNVKNDHFQLFFLSIIENFNFFRILTKIPQYVDTDEKPGLNLFEIIIENQEFSKFESFNFRSLKLLTILLPLAVNSKISWIWKFTSWKIFKDLPFQGEGEKIQVQRPTWLWNSSYRDTRGVFTMISSPKAEVYISRVFDPAIRSWHEKGRNERKKKEQQVDKYRLRKGNFSLHHRQRKRFVEDAPYIKCDKRL